MCVSLENPYGSSENYWRIVREIEKEQERLEDAFEPLLVEWLRQHGPATLDEIEAFATSRMPELYSNRLRTLIWNLMNYKVRLTSGWTRVEAI